MFCPCCATLGERPRESLLYRSRFSPERGKNRSLSSSTPCLLAASNVHPIDGGSENAPFPAWNDCACRQFDGEFQNSET
jgi:hypothetical protein